MHVSPYLIDDHELDRHPFLAQRISQARTLCSGHDCGDGDDDELCRVCIPEQRFGFFHTLLQTEISHLACPIDHIEAL